MQFFHVANAVMSRSGATASFNLRAALSADGRLIMQHLAPYSGHHAFSCLDAGRINTPPAGVSASASLLFIYFFLSVPGSRTFLLLVARWGGRVAATLQI